MWKKLKQALQVMSVLLLYATIVACAGLKPSTPTTATTVGPDCINWKTLDYSASHDSDETVREIIQSNAARAAVCPTEKP